MGHGVGWNTMVTLGKRDHSYQWDAHWVILGNSHKILPTRMCRVLLFNQFPLAWFREISFFIPRWEMRSISSRGPIVYTKFWVRKFWTLSKSGRVSQLFFPLKCFIPRWEMRSISSRGPIIFTYLLFTFGLGNVYGTFKITLQGSIFFP